MVHGGRISHVDGPGAAATAWTRSSRFDLTASDRAMLTAVAGVSFGFDEAPDFDSVRRGGGTVNGVIPGGYESVGFNDGENQVIFFAVQVSQDRQAGRLNGDITPQYLRGLTFTLNEHSTDARRKEFIDLALDYYDQLPRTAAEAHRRRSEPTFIVSA
jgi:hypothetical protein